MMLRMMFVVSFVIVALTLAPAADTSTTQSAAAFEKLKSLAGNWESKNGEGQKSHTRYEVLSGGSAVVERYVNESMSADKAMETVYYLDGDRLLLTHYCMAHNQPRMQAESFDSSTGSLQFAYLDATGLANPSAGHMHDVKFTFADNDHFTADWQFYEGGKPKFTESVQFTRVK
jgi:hypothetical protein